MGLTLLALTILALTGLWDLIGIIGAVFTVTL